MKLLLILPFLLGAYTSAKVPRFAQTATPAPERTPTETTSREIDHLAKLAGLPSLKSSTLAQGDVDAPVWYGSDLILLEGLALKRTDNQWNAWAIGQDKSIRLEYDEPPSSSGKL
jgi:hypothetical protein